MKPPRVQPASGFATKAPGRRNMGDPLQRRKRKVAEGIPRGMFRPGRLYIK